MFGYFLFGLTVLVYIVISLFVLQPAPSGSDQNYGWASSALVLIAAYGVCSLLLTINITANGGFNWISDAKLKRNAIVAILWFGMVVGVTYCTLKPEYHKIYQLTGFIRLLSQLISYGAIWLPLLMLIPYYLFLKPEWRDTLSPNLFKTLLVFASVVGFLLPITPKIILKSYKKFDERELAFNEAMKNIEKYQHVSSLLYYTDKSYDEQIRNVALTKIKASKNLEAELIETLEQHSSYDVFDFLDENKVEHPERFIEPIIKSFDRLTADMHEDIVNPYKRGVFNVEVLLRVLEGQFKDSIAVFKPHILKLQEVMETPPAKSRAYDDTEQVNETIYKYREDVKNWLAKH
ncbi:MAG: hypothetical protein IPO85_00185 [Saprospiraceae bacterium]|uniref:Uncharacterized protein n=1 Tax=Candidatus Defluviibacterium haderslevense TaxID=2981993 RepID=A0A9D7S506_9BACT|nr:hypothetical protein [Candidatus Defluviibacterium haderslevense]